MIEINVISWMWWSMLLCPGIIVILYLYVQQVSRSLTIEEVVVSAIIGLIPIINLLLASAFIVCMIGVPLIEPYKRWTKNFHPIWRAYIVKDGKIVLRHPED